MQNDNILTWSDSMYKGRDLAELTFDEAIDRELALARTDNDIARTTVHIPLWVRTAISRLHVERGVSEGKLYTAIINYGTSITKRVYKDRIHNMEGVRYELLKSDNDIIKSMVGDFKICVNGVQGSKDRRTIRVPTWCKGYLGTVGTALRMEFSSMVRLSMYLAFVTCPHISKKDVQTCKHEVKKFERKLDNYSKVCITLLTTDDGYSVINSADLKKLVNAGIIKQRMDNMMPVYYIKDD